MKKSYIFLADGFETIEALTPVDVMRRAGMDIKTVCINPSKVAVSAQGIPVTADFSFDEIASELDSAEWLILPGGMPGASNLHDFAPLASLLTRFKGNIAAICAAPAVVLGQLGLLAGMKATCYPGFEEQLTDAIHSSDPVVVTDRIITANGPATALRFSLAIVAASLGASVADQVAAGMLLK